MRKVSAASPLTEEEIAYLANSKESKFCERVSLPQSVLTHSQLPRQREPKNPRKSLPSSDEEGVSGIAADGRRDSVPCEFERKQVLRTSFSPSVCANAQTAPSQRGPRERRNPCLPLTRKVSNRRFDERRDNAPIESESKRVLRKSFSPSVCANAQPAPSSEGAKRPSYPLPSSDEEGVKPLV